MKPDSSVQISNIFLIYNFIHGFLAEFYNVQESEDSELLFQISLKGDSLYSPYLYYESHAKAPSLYNIITSKKNNYDNTTKNIRLNTLFSDESIKSFLQKNAYFYKSLINPDTEYIVCNTL